MLVHFPPYARHGFKATEDGDLKYLYIKDRTWTLIGAAADEALPDKALTATQVQKDVKAGKYPGGKKEPEKSAVIIDGLGNCYYPMIESLEAPPVSGHCARWVEGTNIAFGFVESPPGHAEEEQRSAHEIFVYVIAGALDTRVGDKKRKVGTGDVIHVPLGTAYRWTVTKGGPARYCAVHSTPRLKAAIRKNGAADNWRG
jgi:quercetin dioxygenase-like cupin family protein